MHPLLKALAPPLVFEPAWFQGRGAFGGLVCAALADAMRAEVGPELPLRSFSARLIGPGAGPVQVSAGVDRVGRTMSHAHALLSGPDGVVARASASYGASREVSAGAEPPRAPPLPGPDHLDPIDVESVGGPAFTRFLEYRPAAGAPPYQGLDVPMVAHWVRLRPGLPLDERVALTLLDASPPALLSGLDRFRPTATVDLAARVFAPLEGPADAWWLLVAEAGSLRDGYVEERQSLYARDGRLALRSTQLLAVF